LSITPVLRHIAEDCDVDLNCVRTQNLTQYFDYLHFSAWFHVDTLVMLITMKREDQRTSHPKTNILATDIAVPE
jgi:hypothetical protein